MEITIAEYIPIITGIIMILFTAGQVFIMDTITILLITQIIILIITTVYTIHIEGFTLTMDIPTVHTTLYTPIKTRTILHIQIHIEGTFL